MPCEKDHIVMGHEILQRGLTGDIAEHALGKNWSALYCSPLGLQVRQRGAEIASGNKNVVENPSL